jgi:hypothetical protein
MPRSRPCRHWEVITGSGWEAGILAILKFKTDEIGRGLYYTGLHHFGILVEEWTRTEPLPLQKAEAAK